MPARISKTLFDALVFCLISANGNCYCTPPRDPLTSTSPSDIPITDIRTDMRPKKSDLPEDVLRLIPLTPAVFFILFALANSEKHGYAIMQETAKLSDGKFRM